MKYITDAREYQKKACDDIKMLLAKGYDKTTPQEEMKLRDLLWLYDAISDWVEDKEKEHAAHRRSGNGEAETPPRR